MLDGEQRRQSAHHTTFLHADAGPNILADNANWLRTRLIKNGVPPVAIERHLSVIGNPQAMEAALAWYRARGVRHAPVGPTSVPTLFIWGDQDDTVGRAAAVWTAEFNRRLISVRGFTWRRPLCRRPSSGAGERAGAGAPRSTSCLTVLYSVDDQYRRVVQSYRQIVDD
jgi:hypothetical protein